MGNTPSSALRRAFVAQLFTSESVASDVHHRAMILATVGFLLPPGLFIVVGVLPQYQIAVLRASVQHSPAILDDALAQIAFLLVTYSMVTIGFVAAFVWDGLAFDRRDAMVLGPLPLGPGTVIGAKLLALAIVLLGASAALNLFTAVPFALFTTTTLSPTSLVQHFAADMTATISAAAFVFALMVALRGTVALAGDGIALRVGSWIQVLFVSALFSFVLLAPRILGMVSTGALTSAYGGWVPTAWFLALFERMMGSARPEYAPLAARALIATGVASALGILVSVAGYRAQIQRALVPSASVPTGSAAISRAVAHVLTRGRPLARAVADFVLLTFARNRRQRTPIALTLAIALTIVVTALAMKVHDIASLSHPRAAVLWIPLVLTYWLAIGVRGTFFVPSEVPAAWCFGFHAPDTPIAYRSAVRAAALGIVLPPGLAIALLAASPLGWRLALWHGAFVGLLAVLLVSLLASTIQFVPYTIAHPPGHARLRTRWPFYAVGMFAFAYVPAKLELGFIGQIVPLLVLLGCALVVVLAGEIACRRREPHWRLPDDDAADDLWEATRLDIGWSEPLSGRAADPSADSPITRHAAG
ncbi:MAG TPA: hypothetical protein VFX12_10025 [Vicinamibacterales bacterium]|nr:hypothetical protein [Vicinamibacterales bacterium]